MLHCSQSVTKLLRYYSCQLLALDCYDSIPASHFLLKVHYSVKHILMIISEIKLRYFRKKIPFLPKLSTRRTTLYRMAFWRCCNKQSTCQTMQTADRRTFLRKPSGEKSNGMMESIQFNCILNNSEKSHRFLMIKTTPLATFTSTNTTTTYRHGRICLSDDD